MKKNLVFGIGSGRCGTASLAYLMSQQESTHSSHELFPVLKWSDDMSTLTYKWTLMDHQSHLFDTVFDTGTYYLNYVQSLINGWNNHEYAKERYNLKFVCLKREKEATVKSFLEKFKRQNNNPLQNHNDASLVTNEWDLAFPKYDGVSLREAVENYYDDYYDIAEQFQKHNPEIFKIFDTEDLNSQQGVSSILSFVGYENSVFSTNIKKRGH